MYQNELSHEAKLIVQGQQAYLSDLTRLLARCKAWIVSRLTGYQV